MTVIDKSVNLIKNRNFILYVIIGFSGAIIDFLIFLVLSGPLGIQPAISSFISVSLGITNNFILNSSHNFKTKDRYRQRFIKFYSIGLAGTFMSVILIFVLFNIIGISAIISKILTIPPVVLIQYALNTKYSFKATEN